MARDANGTYALPLPDVITGDVIEASWANTTLSDIETEMTDSLSRSGSGGMLSVLKVVDGTVSAPGISFVSEANSGMYRAGSTDVRIAVNGSDTIKFEQAQISFYANGTLHGYLDSSGFKTNDSGYKFSNDTDTGIELGAVGQLDLVVGGTTICEVSGSTPEFTVTGYASATQGFTTAGTVACGTFNGNFVKVTGLSSYIGTAANTRKINITGGDSYGDGGNITVYGSNHATNGGEVEIDGKVNIVGLYVKMPDLPTSDPTSAGQLWNDSGTLKVSAG